MLPWESPLDEMELGQARYGGVSLFVRFLRALMSACASIRVIYINPLVVVRFDFVVFFRIASDLPCLPLSPVVRRPCWKSHVGDPPLYLYDKTVLQEQAEITRAEIEARRGGSL